jgi:putative DNA primase/helicase
MEKLCSVAQSYVETLGFSVIPADRQKKAFIKWKEFQSRKPIKDEIIEWSSKWPDVNVALVTGEISNLTVVDTDDQPAIDTVLAKIPKSVRCPIAKTPRGGRHFYFRYDRELETVRGIFPKCDIRSEGGFVIAPPSSGMNGNPYEWEVSPFEVSPPPMPEELREFLLSHQRENMMNDGSFRFGQAAVPPELQELIDQYGVPYYANSEGEVKAINEPFWAGLHQAEHIQFFEPEERAFYRYNPDNGLYRAISEDVIKQEIAARILDISRQFGLPSLERKRTNSVQNNIVAQLRGISEKRDVFRRKKDIVHLANGVIVFKDNNEADFCEHSPDFVSRNQSPIPFNESAKCDRFINELLIPSVSPDDAVLLQKYAGLCLLGDNLIQKLLILDGMPGRGKSTMALIIQKLVGQDNFTELRTKQLTERFELFRFRKRNLLVGVDVPGKFLSEEGAHVIKGLVGGDSFDAEQKCGTGCFPFQGNFCILITSNSRLRVRLDGDNGAWARRLLIIRFEGPVPSKKIPNFADLLIREEGSGILNWALDGLRMLLKDIKETGDIQLTEAQADIVGKLLEESDSLRHFLEEKVVQNDNADLSTSEIIESYAEYCPLKGWNAKPITIIHKELESLMLELFRTSKSHSIMRGSKSVNGFRRVAFKPKEDEQ